VNKTATRFGSHPLSQLRTTVSRMIRSSNSRLGSVEVQFVAIVSKGTKTHITGGDDITILYCHRFVDTAFECRSLGGDGGRLCQLLVNDLCV
jgi:hypothetical protein